MKKIIFTLFIVHSTLAQVSFPNSANSSDPNSAERVSSFTVSGAGNDRLEIVNGTQVDGVFVPTIWGYRNTNNTFGMVFTSSIASNLDTGTNPIMLFTTNIAPSFQLNSPNIGDFPWGNFGTTVPIVNRPIFQWRNNSLRIMTMLANGYVGIGTDIPTANFHNNGSVRLENLSDSTSPFKLLGTDSSGNVFEYNLSEISTTNSDFDWLKLDGSFSTSIDDNIYTNGNVGIGTNTPTANLHNKGTVRFENLQDSSNPFKLLGTDSSGNVFEYNLSEVGTGTNLDYDWLKTDGSVPNSIDDSIYTNGKVAINTNVFPTMVGDVDVSNYSLFAKGGILTEEVRVALSSEWADYVFGENYKLDSLQEVEKYIIENKHLKDVPDSQEVKTDGIELGLMNKILLQKIEELTLYVIELNKKIELQNYEIQKLKEK